MTKLTAAAEKRIRAHAQGILDELDALHAPPPSAGFTVQAGKIYDGATEIELRGVNHYGFESVILRPMQLWDQGWREQIAQMGALGFNAVRLPFCPDTLRASAGSDSYLKLPENQELVGKTPLEVLDLWMAEADRAGLYVLLDLHTVSQAWQVPQWFDDSIPYKETNWTADLVFVAERYASLKHFIGVDLYNEPHGQVRWSAGDANMTDARYYWKAAAESAAAAVLAANPRLLVFVEGISGNFDGIEKNLPINWGEDCQPQAYQPLSIPANKLVLSPHSYGPDVYMKSSFSAPDFPHNLASDWETLFGYLHPQHAVVPGEFGGRYSPGSLDQIWQDAFVDYLSSKGMRSGFYWSFTDSDAGAIVEGGVVREDKMTLLRRLWA